MLQDRKGFTIIELLIVIVVIGVLAALVITSFAQAQSRARDSKRISDIVAVQKALEAYYAEQGNYPTSDCLSSPWWNCWGAGGSTGRLVPVQYLPTMPQDPGFVDDSACGYPNNGATRAYYYLSTPSAQGYLLGTRLEAPNTNDPRYGVGTGAYGCGNFMNYTIKKNWP